MDTESQIPKGFRRAKRWQIALKVWGITSTLLGAVVALSLVGIEWVSAGHLVHRAWQLALAGFGIAAVVSVPVALRIRNEYPAAGYWK